MGQEDMQDGRRIVFGDSITFFVRKGKNKVIKTGRPTQNREFVDEIKTKIAKIHESKEINL